MNITPTVGTGTDPLVAEIQAHNEASSVNYTEVDVKSLTADTTDGVVSVTSESSETEASAAVKKESAPIVADTSDLTECSSPTVVSVKAESQDPVAVPDSSVLSLLSVVSVPVKSEPMDISLPLPKLDSASMISESLSSCTTNPKPEFSSPSLETIADVPEADIAIKQEVVESETPVDADS